MARHHLLIALVLVLAVAACGEPSGNELGGNQAATDRGGGIPEPSGVPTTIDPGVDTDTPAPAPDPGEAVAADPESPSSTVPGTIGRDDRPQPDPEDLPEPVPSAEEYDYVTGEAPAELLGSVIADLTDRFEVAAASVTVLADEAVVWPDGSLGCPAPGEMYTMAQVPGYRILLEAGGTTYDYRAADGGYFMLCKPGLGTREWGPLPGPTLIEPPDGGSPQS